MSGFDLLIAAVLVFSIALGVMRGFVREAFSLAKWVLSVFLAWALSGEISGLFEKDIAQPAAQQVAAFITLFIVFFIIGSVITAIAHKLMTKKPFFKISNYVLGAVVGAIRGVLVLVIGFQLAGLFPSIPKSDWWRSSEFAPYFEGAAMLTKDVLPRDIARYIRYD